MIRIGLIDDDLGHLRLMRDYLARYEQEEGIMFQVKEFHNGLNFVDDYDGQLDIVFLDIEMPHMDGMTAAHKIRERDASLAIIFLTNLAQYAIRGYEVNAIDFVVKPMGYFLFADKLKKAMRFIHRNVHQSIILQTEESVVKVIIPDILYIEKEKNYLVYYTRTGTYRVRGTMSALSDTLLNEGFSLCLSGCLVNLRYVTSINKDTISVGETVLPVSQQRRKGFKEDFLKYLGGDL